MSRDPVEKRYSNGELTIIWKPALCIHSRLCWTQLSSVFDPEKRPWVTVTGATSQEIADQVRRCPSGALSLLGDEPQPSAAPAAAAAPAPAPAVAARPGAVTRERLIHRLHEAAELEHSLMCTYLYAAYSLRRGVDEGLSPREAEATASWRRTIIGVSIEEMGHLAAVWNLTSALGGSPRFGRDNFPIAGGVLPGAVVVKLAPFTDATIQHLIHLERPKSSSEPDGQGFEPAPVSVRGTDRERLTPMSFDYETVGVLYTTIEAELRALVDSLGEAATFCGDPALQLGPGEVVLRGVSPITDLASALDALRAIVEQGEGAADHIEGSHFARFAAIRAELAALRAENPAFEPAHPAATNAVLRRPLQPAGRVWIEHEPSARTVDIANASYALMLRLLSYSYVVPHSNPTKGAVVRLGIELMRAVSLLGERAARMPAGPATPGVNAGVSFTALRDTAPFPPGPAALRVFTERFAEIAAAVAALDQSDPRVADAAQLTAALATRAAQDLR